MQFFAMIIAGFNITQLNGLLASLNVPTITQKSLEKQEKEVLNQLEVLVKEVVDGTLIWQRI